jgi:PleD family two-component response regulator
VEASLGKVERKIDVVRDGFTVRPPISSGAVEAAPSGSGPVGTLSQMRILVVDDNRDAAESLGMLLQVLGAQVWVAHGGLAALDAFATTLPTVVPLDMGMSGWMDTKWRARYVHAFPDKRSSLR